MDVEPVMPRVSLSAILRLAAGLRLWRLDHNGFGNECYGAGVRSMSLVIQTGQPVTARGQLSRT